jgi:hypothetical protein
VVAVAAAAADSSAVEYVRLMKICMGLTELSLERHGALGDGCVCGGENSY